MEQVIKSAAENNTCAVFVAHDINTSINLSVTLSRLKKMVNLVTVRFNKAIQEQQQQIQELKKEVAEMKELIRALK